MEPSSSPNQPGSEQLVFNTIVFPDQQQGPVRRVHVPLMFEEPATRSFKCSQCSKSRKPVSNGGHPSNGLANHSIFLPYTQAALAETIHAASRAICGLFIIDSHPSLCIVHTALKVLATPPLPDEHFFRDCSFLIRAIHVRPLFSLQTIVSLTFSGFLFFCLLLLSDDHYKCFFKGDFEIHAWLTPSRDRQAELVKDARLVVTLNLVSTNSIVRSPLGLFTRIRIASPFMIG